MASLHAADYTTYLTSERGFTEVTTVDGIFTGDSYYYILVPAETRELIVGVGRYEAKAVLKNWESPDETKALRYRSAETDPVLDLTNFFTIEKSGSYIGLRNVVYNSDLFQTHENQGYLYINSFSDANLDEWSYLIPHRERGYWLFENGKYPMSSDAQWKGYMGPWNPGVIAPGEPIALNRLNTAGDEAGHYRLFRIKKSNILRYSMYLTPERGFTEVTSFSSIAAGANDYYILTSAEDPTLIVGIGDYEVKPDGAPATTKALRYRSATTDPVLDLTNFFNIRKKGTTYIGLRNVVYSADFFQTHDGMGFLYVNSYSDKSLNEWSYLIPTFQNGYWQFENGKYPASSDAQWKGYMGPWNNRVEADQPIALNRLNTAGDEAGHYRLFHISKTNLLALKRQQLFTADISRPIDATWLITNPSFETGDETGWTLGDKKTSSKEFKACDYEMSLKDGGYLMNVLEDYNGHSVSQVVKNVPSGSYELKATVCTWSGRTVYVTVLSGGVTKMATATGVDDVAGTEVTIPFTVGNDQTVTISVDCPTDWWSDGHSDESWVKTFYKFDNVRLTCKSVCLNALAQNLPNNNTTLLKPGQWYYYDAELAMNYWLAGNLDGMVYSEGGSQQLDLFRSAPVQRNMALSRGRVYFKTVRDDATLSIAPAQENEESGTFTAVALNVDGLPNKIASIDLNPDGPGADGTRKISRYLASKNYDFIGCSEDFNYNGPLMESLNDRYWCGTIRNTLSLGDLSYWDLMQGKIHVDTDGLNLIWKYSTVSASNESWTGWNTTEATDGNQYVNKGYRHYDLQLGDGPVIDVYILHMDAGDTNATWSREAQWRQLAAAINSTDHSRAKLIIGDTNSRWTREDITGNFMELLSSDFTMSDVWVEFHRNGIYPAKGQSHFTDKSNPTDYSKYEIVDKIIYINPKAANTVQIKPKSFRIEQDYTYGTIDGDGNTKALGDHDPLVVAFSYTRSGAVSPLTVGLSNASSNEATLANVIGATANVTLRGRTLYRDGTWNTLCLPFDVPSFAGTPLEGAVVKELDTEASYAGHRTGIDGTTLHLYFREATSIVAGRPYLVRWTEGKSLSNPVFRGVMSTTEPGNITSADGKVTMQGCFSPVAVKAGDKTVLCYGDDNILNYPSADMNIYTCRAFFRLSEELDVTDFVVGFDDDFVGVGSVEISRNGADAIYDLSGRRFDNVRLKRGLYIQGNRKVLVR